MLSILLNVVVGFVILVIIVSSIVIIAAVGIAAYKIFKGDIKIGK